jgi:hypothetical protein
MLWSFLLRLTGKRKAHNLLFNKHVNICAHNATSLHGVRNKPSYQLSKSRLATLNNSVSYIRKWNGVQHFESNNIKYAPKSFENKVYKGALPSKDNGRSSH